MSALKTALPCSASPNCRHATATRLDTNYAQYINAVTVADVQRVAAKYFVHPVISTIEPGVKSSGKAAGG